MKRLIGLAIKILPLITLWQGITSGGARLKPFVDTIKVALTQYEVGQIAQKVIVDLNQAGELVSPEDFSQFIRRNVHNQYSVLAREIKGDKTHDHAMDIWGRPFQLIHDQMAKKVKITSAGPDLRVETKDDVAVDFGFEIRRSDDEVYEPQMAVNEAAEEQKVRPVSEEDEYSENTDEYREPATDETIAQEEGQVGYDEEQQDQNRDHYSGDDFYNSGHLEHESQE